MTKRRAGSLLFIAALCLGAGCGAQTISLLHVNLNDHNLVFNVDDAISLHPAGFFPENLRVRVFFASKAVLLKMRSDKDGCIPYFGKVFRGVALPSTIKIDPISSVGHVVSPRVTLVFESGSEPQSETFRLKSRAEVEKYFKNAVEIQLNLPPEESGKGVATVPNQGWQGTGVTLTPAPTPAPPARPCFNVEAGPGGLDTSHEFDSGAAVVATMEPAGCGRLPAPERPAGF